MIAHLPSFPQQLCVSDENETLSSYGTTLCAKCASRLMTQASHLQDQGPPTLTLQTPFSRVNHVPSNEASQNKAAPQVSLGTSIRRQCASSPSGPLGPCSRRWMSVYSLEHYFEVLFVALSWPLLRGESHGI